VTTAAEITRAIRLCRKLDLRGHQKQAPNGHKIDSPEERKQPPYQLWSLLSRGEGERWRGVRALQMRTAATKIERNISGSQIEDCGSQIDFLQIGARLASVPQCCDYARADCRAK